MQIKSFFFFFANFFSFLQIFFFQKEKTFYLLGSYLFIKRKLCNFVLTKCQKKMNNFITQELLDYLKIKFGIVGFNGPMGSAIQSLVQSAPTDLSILITGDTGTGKEVFANAIHGLSKRKNRPFVSVNCGAIPETLLESELFGREKGAYTSADSSRMGFFETADKGANCCSLKCI